MVLPEVAEEGMLGAAAKGTGSSLQSMVFVNLPNVVVSGGELAVYDDPARFCTACQYLTSDQWWLGSRPRRWLRHAMRMGGHRRTAAIDGSLEVA